MTIQDSQVTLAGSVTVCSKTTTGKPISTLPSFPIDTETTVAAGIDNEPNPVTKKAPIPAISKDDTEEHSSGVRTSVGDLKNETDGSVNPGEETPEESLDKTEEDTKPETLWKSTAPLYCKVNGRSHAALIDFYIWRCPECKEDLRPGEEQIATSDSDDSSEDEDTPEESEKPAQPVSYSVEYRDCDNNVITAESWEGPFDFASARKGVRSADRSVFDVVTVLETSLPADSRRLPYEIDEIMKKGILDNPNVAVAVGITRITIRSTELIKTIRNIAQYYPASLEGEILQMDAPYMLIAHHIKELEAYLESHRVVGALEQSPLDETAVDSTSEKQAYQNVGAEHLAILMDFFKETVYSDMVEEKSRHARNACTFKMLWLLYRPGITVYYESDGRLSAYVVNTLESEEKKGPPGSRSVKEYTVKMWNLNFDGRFVGRCAKSVTIPQFDGERQINSLRLFPCEFIDKEDGGKTRQRLEENGKGWYDLLRGGQVHYSGRLLDGSKKNFQGRVYIDMSSYYDQGHDDEPEICDIDDLGEELAKCECEDCHGYRPHPPTDFPWTRYDLIDPNVEKDLEIPGAIHGPRHRYLLCDRSLHGFDLRSRGWVELDVACCQPPKMNVRAIDTLVMPSDRKEMIKALIQKFTASNSSITPSSWRADFLENKGEGQIFLLHGSPGVGKTYKWGAVMLIDEADVFLEKRQVTDLKRNSLVSVFLRCIEYYRGVLFLTTNRVGHFDDAFMSRIHVVIYYDKLGIDDRRKIWEQFFDKLSDEREDFVITGRAKSYVLEDDTICQIEWNGREIRNAFQTAVSLAEFRFLQKPNKTKNDYPTLDQKDFEQVCKMVRQFKQYLVDVHGVDEDGRAFMYKARRDSRNSSALPRGQDRQSYH
ncbi:hypothetical protein G7Z17_g2379 [Cylindrodendrum hubeiense]|uniref:ATPase AAA-type core domain-containing protein n=1 Tax=Cylindrodendrum hubeiense TaxID=595255 RepID=A0A9P5HGN9_9HYPO|nr:hypothetical protein G7Z17_g2379 [Cylindrodendrum hubeiense]